jgi:CRP-like cAMP-binding protein
VESQPRQPAQGAAPIQSPLAARGRAVLAAQGWLSRAPEPFREAVLSHTIWRTAEPGDVIASAGDEIGGLIGLAEGVLSISSPARVAIPVVHLFHPGDWTGQVPIITGQPRRMTTEVRSAALYALVTQADMLRILARNPVWWRELALQSDDASDTALHAATELMMPDSSRRTAGALLRLGGCRPPRWPDPRGEALVSQDELATIAAVSRNTLSRILHQFEKDGLIEAGYRRIRLLDAARLRDIAYG